MPKNGEITSKITQPPNIGFGLYNLALKTQLTEKTEHTQKNKELLSDLFEKTLKYHRYIYKNRVIDGCMVSIHPWECGDDNSPKWDLIYKEIYGQVNNGSNMKDLVFNWLHGLGLEFDRVDVKIIHPDQRPLDYDYFIYLFLIFLYGQWGWNEETILKESPFRVIDPMTNAVLLRSNTDLIKLGYLLEIADKKIYAELESWVAQTQKGLESLWSDEHSMYMTKDLTTNGLLKYETISGLIPIFSGGIRIERVGTIAKKISLLTYESKIKYWVPSTFPDQSDVYDPLRYWRGPVWIILNEVLADGLENYKHIDLANKLRANNLTLVIQSLEKNGGFYEYYNPETGDGLGSARQSWSAAAILKALSSSYL